MRIRRACDGIDELVASFLAQRERVYPSGKFEAPIEALNLLYLAIRNLEGVLLMARHDLVLLPPAMLASRAAFENAAIGAWLVDCKDPLEAEGRWLAHLRKEQDYLDRLEKRVSDAGAQFGSAQREALRKFSDAVEVELSKRGRETTSRPKFDRLLISLGSGELYSHYMTCSQFALGTHVATWQFRRGLGGSKVFKEVVNEEQWHLPLHLCCEALARFGKRVLDKTGNGRNLFPVPEVLKRARKQVRKLVEDTSQSRPVGGAFKP